MKAVTPPARSPGGTLAVGVKAGRLASRVRSVGCELSCVSFCSSALREYSASFTAWWQRSSAYAENRPRASFHFSLFMDSG